MELIKRSLHMEGPKISASKQMVLEDDVIIPDTNKDADKLLLDRGKITIEEVSAGEDVVHVKGMLHFQVLYMTEGDKGGNVSKMEGNLPFEEKIQMEGIHAGEKVEVTSVLEEMTLGLINSRKVSVRALVRLNAVQEPICEEEIPVGLSGEETIEFRRKTLPIAALVVKNQDVFKVKEEIEIPGSYPNISTLIYWDADISNVDFKVLENKVSIQGELKVFCMYLGEEDDNELYHYETTVPFSGSVDCPDCAEGMLSQISYQIDHCEAAIRPDYDGEDRILAVEMGMRLQMKIYEEDDLELVSDVYGVTKEVDTASKSVDFCRLHSRNTGKCKISEHFKTGVEGSNIYKVIHTTGEIQIENSTRTEQGVLITGQVLVKILYEDSDETRRFGIIRGEIPFEYLLQVDGIPEDCRLFVCSTLEQLAVSIIDTDEVDVKCVILFRADVLQTWREELVEQLNLSEPDMEKQSALPGIAVYRIKEGESLWDIGKRYYVPISTLMQTNNLTSEEVRPGDKILIVK